MDIGQTIAQYKASHRAVIAAHTYQAPEIQAVADIVGDSYALAMHIDTDESNAAGCGREVYGEIVK